MEHRRLYETILGLSEPWYVKGVQFRAGGRGNGVYV
jgi:hypothetical protein